MAPAVSCPAQTPRRHPCSQRCAGSPSKRGCQSKETVNGATDTGSAKLCLPAYRTATEGWPRSSRPCHQVRQVRLPPSGRGSVLLQPALRPGRNPLRIARSARARTEAARMRNQGTEPHRQSGILMHRFLSRHPLLKKGLPQLQGAHPQHDWRETRSRKRDAAPSWNPQQGESMIRNHRLIAETYPKESADLSGQSSRSKNKAKSSQPTAPHGPGEGRLCLLRRRQLRLKP